MFNGIFGGGGGSSSEAVATSASVAPATGSTTRPDIPAQIEKGLGPTLVQLDLYQISLPRDSISNNEQFWKHVDEERLDPETMDLLKRNGVRVGIAPDDDWDYFKDILERSNARAVKGSVMSGETGTLELSMKKNISQQDIAVFQEDGDLVGKRFDRCENLLIVSFVPEARRPGNLHVTVAPIVRSTRSRLEYRSTGEEREIVEVKPEHLYNMNLRVEIPAGWFLVIGPSPQSVNPMSVGNAFLMSDGDLIPRETVLVMAPKAARKTSPTTGPMMK